MDASAYAFVHGLRRTRSTLEAWNRDPWRVLRGWVGGSLLAACGLLAAVWVIAMVAGGTGPAAIQRPPFQTGTPSDVLRILGRNLLVLALHAMACVAGFIAGSSLPLEAKERTGLTRVIHEHGGRLAIVFVVGATTFSLSAQALVIGTSLAHVATAINVAPGVLLLGLLPHALPELTALFLPLAAWIIASRRGDWDALLAATFVTVGLALPILVMTAAWEVYAAPHILGPLIR